MCPPVSRSITKFVHVIIHHPFELESPIWTISFIFNFKPVIFYQTLCLLFIGVVLYVFSEAIASECSTSHMAPHMYWFLCTRTGFRHRLWNSLHLYVQAASTQWLALGFTSCYRFSSYYTRFGMSKFYMSTFINHRNNSKTAPISIYFVRLLTWDSLYQH